MYCELKSRVRYILGFCISFMNCELIFALVVLLIDIPLSLGLGYQNLHKFLNVENHYFFKFYIGV